MSDGKKTIVVSAVSLRKGGTLTILRDCLCGPKDVITEGENGFLVSEGNIPMLADRMLRLMEDDELRRCMGLSAYHHSKAFSEEKIMQRWIGLFNNLTI